MDLRSFTAIFAVGAISATAVLASPDQPGTLIDQLRSPEGQAQVESISRAPELLNRVTLLHLGMSSNPVRQRLVKEAKRSVYIDVPYWFNDVEGNKFLDLLREKR